MPGIAVRTLDSAGGPHMGGGQDWFIVDGEPVVVLGDQITPHGLPPHGPLPPTMVEGSDWMSIDGIPVCREGHLASCGHASTGRGWYTIAA